MTAGYITADVGTDHAYVPIYLVREGRIPCAIASDVNIGPLERAREHVCENGLEDKIDLRISNGLFRDLSRRGAVSRDRRDGRIYDSWYFKAGICYC